jgi:hypothetical protein
LGNAARFAAFSTLQRCFALHIDEPALACRLFDCQVLPCLSYGAELWLPFLPDPWSDFDKHMGTPLEKTHVRFLRSITRVGPKSASITLLAECNRAPLYLHCLKQACRFWNKLCQLDHTHVSRDVFIESAALAAAGSDTWVARMVVLMQGYGMFAADVYTCHPGTPITRRSIDVDDVEKTFLHKLEQYWAGHLSSANTTAYRHIYARHFKHSEHVSDLAKTYKPLLDTRLPIHLRRGILRLRVCALRLYGNVGAWTNTTQACPMCTTGAAETESHLLLDCPAYAALRQALGIATGVPFATLFSEAHIERTGRLVVQALRLRTDTLSNST